MKCFMCLCSWLGLYSGVRYKISLNYRLGGEDMEQLLRLLDRGPCWVGWVMVFMLLVVLVVVVIFLKGLAYILG